MEENNTRTDVFEDTTVYQVIMQDEYNNLYLLGLYASLDDAVPDVNEFLEVYDEAKLLAPGDLAEYVGTFGGSFDREVEWKDDSAAPGSVMIRGFALSGRKLMDEIASIAAHHED